MRVILNGEHAMFDTFLVTENHPLVVMTYASATNSSR